MQVAERVLAAEPPATLEEAKQRLMGFAQELGFSHFLYAGGRAFNANRGGHDIWAAPPLVLVETPPGWGETYHEQDFGKIDPIVSATLKRKLPFVWDTERFGLPLTPQQKAMFRIAHDHNVTRGLAIPIYGPMGDFGLFSYVSTESQKEFTRLVENYGHHLHLVSLYLAYPVNAHDRYM